MPLVLVAGDHHIDLTYVMDVPVDQVHCMVHTAVKSAGEFAALVQGGRGTNETSGVNKTSVVLEVSTH